MSEIPKALRNLNFCRVRKQSKSPFEMDWVNKPYSYDKISSFFPNENYGVLCGYNDLAVIDCDKEELALAVKQLLPETFSVRTGGGGTHFYYFIPGLKKKIILNVREEHLGEVQSYGTQAVGAGSLHPNGSHYEVLDNVGIAAISLKELEEVLGNFMNKEKGVTAVTTEDVEDYKDLIEKISKIWKEGDRQELALSVSGYLRKEKRMGINKVKEIIKRVCEITEDEEVKMRLRAVEETFKKDEKNIKGFTGLKGIKLDGKGKKKKKKYVSGFVDEEKQIIVEQIYGPVENESEFCEYNHKTGEIKYLRQVKHLGEIYFPYEGDELKKKAVLLSSKAEDYGSDEELDKEIEEYISTWLDVPDKIVRFGRWNIKRSWVYDKFQTLNYLRALGDTGLGKSRFLATLGHIHYKPLIVTGATTPAPLFRMIDKWKGTLVMDEADLKYSDESADIIKIINQGFEKNSFIMRCDQNDINKIDLFEPFCPKILATRKSFQDKATESRCITHVMGITERKDIPVNLNKDFFKKTNELRNKLLMWRFKNFFEIDMEQKYKMEDLEPRVKQLISSYIPIFSNDKKGMEDFVNYIKEYQQDLIEERRSGFEGGIVEAIHTLLEEGIKEITCKMIVEKGNFVNPRSGKAMEPRAMTPKLKALGFGKTENIGSGKNRLKCIPIKIKHVNSLFKRYGLSEHVEPVEPVVMKSSDFDNIANKEGNKSLGGLTDTTGSTCSTGSLTDEERLKIAEEKSNEK